MEDACVKIVKWNVLVAFILLELSVKMPLETNYNGKFDNLYYKTISLYN